VDVDLINGLLQTGAIGILAYFLIQQMREQAKEHREELKALILQVSSGQEKIACENEKALRGLIADSLEVVRKNTEAITAITGVVHAVDMQIARVEIRLAALKDELGAASSRRRKDAATKNQSGQVLEVKNV